jgi:hypothetical protein
MQMQSSTYFLNKLWGNCVPSSAFSRKPSMKISAREGEIFDPIANKNEMKKPQIEFNKNHNRVALHAQKTNHKFDFENVSVLNFESNWNKRIVAESMAMIAKKSVISQSSRSIDKIFYKTIIDDEKGAKPYFCEKATFNSVSGALQHVQQNSRAAHRGDENHTAASAASAAARQTRLDALPYLCLFSTCASSRPRLTTKRYCATFLTFY